MEINNIKVGQSFKNYKEMCLELGLEIKNSANSKNAQFKELSRFCKYNKIGHKITIEEVFETPLDKVENRGGSHNVIYGNTIQLLITDLLAQCHGHISISRSKLMIAIGMVNVNYGFCSDNVQKLSKYIEMNEKVIYDFYNTCGSNFKSTIETTLKNLMDKRIIMYNTVIKVSEKDTFTPRTATEKELDTIMNIEKETLEEMGYEQISTIRVSSNWKKFRTKVKHSLHEKTNIEYYFTAYDITVNEKYIIEERNDLVNLLLEADKRKDSKNELNEIVYNNIVLNAQKRHEKAFTSGKMAKVRIAETYIEDIKRLANLLICNDTPNLTHKIQSVELEQEIFTKELIDELDKIFG